MRGKRGQAWITAIPAFKLVLALSILGIFLYYVYSVASGSLFEQNFMARDLALLIASSYASPGTLTVTYDTSLSGTKLVFFNLFAPKEFSYTITPSKVEVTNELSKDNRPASYPFGIDMHPQSSFPDKFTGNALIENSLDDFKITSAKVQK